MSLSYQDITLEPLDCNRDLECSELVHVIDAWCELRASSVDSILTQISNLADFVVHNCLLFAAITKSKIGDDSSEQTELSTSEKLTGIRPASGLEYSYHALRSVDNEDSSSGVTLNGHGPDVIVGSDLLTPDIIGIIYLAKSPLPSEARMGIAILAPWRGQGHGSTAAKLAMEWAFTTGKCHRLSTLVLGNAPSSTLRFFQHLGFVHEGVHRRAVQCEPKGEWMDITYLGVLDTEYVMRQSRKSPWNPWDDMAWRHKREKEALQWHDEVALKRTASSETIKQAATDDIFFDPEYENECEDDVSPCSTPSPTRPSSPGTFLRFRSNRKPYLSLLQTSVRARMLHLNHTTMPYQSNLKLFQKSTYPQHSATQTWTGTQ